MSEPTISLRDGESLADYAIRVTRERDEARAELDVLRLPAQNYNRTRARAERAEDERDRLRALLRELEYEDDGSACPLCRYLNPARVEAEPGYRMGHAPDCRLKAALEE